MSFSTPPLWVCVSVIYFICMFQMKWLHTVRPVLASSPFLCEMSPLCYVRTANSVASRTGARARVRACYKSAHYILRRKQLWIAKYNIPILDVAKRKFCRLHLIFFAPVWNVRRACCCLEMNCYYFIYYSLRNILVCFSVFRMPFLLCRLQVAPPNESQLRQDLLSVVVQA